MSAASAPDHPNPAPGLDPGLALQLPADAYYHLIRTLRLTLPPPLGDSPTDLARRDHAVVARIAALAPANAAEADLAAQFVAASEQWKDCLRLAQLPETSPEWAAKCRAQASGMMRQANSALRLLLRLQEARRKLEADSAACNRLAWTEHCAIGLMAQALSGHPTKSDDFPGTPLSPHAAPPAPVAQPESAPLAHSLPRNAEDAMPDGPGAETLAAAEEYALVYPERAALIRRFGRLPDDVSFGPPEDEVVQALIRGRPRGLAALNAPFPEARAA